VFMIQSETYPAFTVDKYRVHATPIEDWNGTRYGRGIYLKFTNWRKGQTLQFVASVGMNRSLYFYRVRQCLND
jgi:hypothetical protein